MAKLHELTNGFMESFLRNNPKSLVDSNGYTRSQYEGELAQRAAIAAQPPIEPPAFLPDHRPQFQCTMPDPAAFDTPEEQLGVNNSSESPLVIAPSTQYTGPQVAQQETLSETDASQTESVEYVDTTAYELYEREQSVPAEDVNLAAEPETQASNLTTEAPPGEIKASDSEQ